MTFWAILIFLSCAALAFAAWPLFRATGRFTLMLAGVIVFIAGSSAALYMNIGAPGIPSGAGSLPDANEMVASLQKRLESNSGDVNGWTMLGRSYQTLQQFDKAVLAFEKAFELENGQNAQTSVALALALMAQNGGEMPDRASSLFESALALQPDNANALFYAGGAAARRGDTALAADRWETLLGQNAPPEIRELLQKKIDEWRGGAVQPIEQTGTVVTLNVSLSENAMTKLTSDTTVFVIARDPSQPSPPIAVVRRRLSELPTSVELSDRDSMIPGRVLSGFAELELIARVSISGAPVAQPGDWFGSMIVEMSKGQTVDLIIDQAVP